jgi:hypothetical protein
MKERGQQSQMQKLRSRKCFHFEDAKTDWTRVREKEREERSRVVTVIMIDERSDALLNLIKLILMR